MFTLHIGRNKAGSSTIQAFLAADEAAIARAGVVVPRLVKPTPAGHQFWATSLRRGGPMDEGERAAYAEAFAAVAARPATERFLVSSEFLFELAPERIRGLAGALAGHRVRLVLYLRDYPSWLASVYAQMTRKGANVDDFDTLARKLIDRTLARFPGQLAAWAEAFGDAALHVRTLDPASLDGGDLVEDALAAAGLGRAVVAAHGGTSAAAEEEERRNVSPPWHAIETVRTVAAALRPSLGVGRGFGQRKGEVRRLLRAVAGWQAEIGAGNAPVPYLTPQQFAEARQLFERDVALANARMADFAIPLDTPEPLPPRRATPSIDLVPAAQRREIAARLAADPFVAGLAADLRARLLSRVAGG